MKCPIKAVCQIQEIQSVGSQRTVLRVGGGADSHGESGAAAAAGADPHGGSASAWILTGDRGGVGVERLDTRALVFTFN